MEAFTWIVKKNVNTPPSSDCCLLVVGEKQVEVVSITGENISPVNNTVRNVIEASLEEKSVAKSKPSESGYISEEDKKDSKSSSFDKIDDIGETAGDGKSKEVTDEISPEKEIPASPDDGIKESPASPDMLTEIEHEIRKSMENLLETNEKADGKNITIEVESEAESKETIEKTAESNQNTKDETEESKAPKSPTKSRDGSPKKNLEVQKSKSLLANLFGNNRPLSPNVGNKLVQQDDPNCPAILPLPEDCLHDCGLLVNLLHQLLCRQWKAVTSVKTEEGNSLLFFRHDPRILPGLGQQSLAGFSCNSQGAIHLHNASQEIVESVKLFANLTNLGNEKWSEFSVKEELPLSKGRELLTEIISVFNNYNFTLYSSVELQMSGQHTNLLLFRPSTVQASAFLGLTLGQGNLLTLDGGGQEEIDGVREILSSRWPYPISTDMAVSASCWSWKVKRYPWRMSYGNKLVDRAVDRASKMVRQLSFPPPNNHDLESAKSLLVCLMKELSERGWKFVGAHNLHTSKCLLHFSK